MKKLSLILTSTILAINGFCSATEYFLENLKQNESIILTVNAEKIKSQNPYSEFVESVGVKLKYELSNNNEPNYTGTILIVGKNAWSKQTLKSKIVSCKEVGIKQYINGLVTGLECIALAKNKNGQVYKSEFRLLKPVGNKNSLKGLAHLESKLEGLHLVSESGLIYHLPGDYRHRSYYLDL